MREEFKLLLTRRERGAATHDAFPFKPAHTANAGSYVPKAAALRWTRLRKRFSKRFIALSTRNCSRVARRRRRLCAN